MRVTNSLVTVVAWLVADADSEHWGYEITESTGVNPGALYPMLQRLVDEGWLTSRWEDATAARAEARPPRRLYSVTDVGMTSMGALLRTLENKRKFNRPALGMGS